MTRELRHQLSTSRALVLDFDGTLAPNLDLPDMKRQVIELTLAHGVPEPVFADAFIVEIIELANAWLVGSDAAAAARYGRAAHALITDIEMRAAGQTAVFPQARALLGKWRSRAGRSAIVTRNCRAAVEHTYPQVHEEVDAVLARDDVPHLKPDTRHLQHALERLDVPGSAALMIGDGRMDMQIGRAHGLFCVGVLSGSSDRAALEEAGADCVLEHIADLLTVLNQL